MIRHIDTAIKVEKESYCAAHSRAGFAPHFITITCCGAIDINPEQATAEDVEHCGFETFSRNIQVAFERSMDEHQSGRSWLISTPY